MRRVDLIGVTGVLMLSCGASFFLFGNFILPLWVAWLVGPLMWYLGAAFMIVWMLYRLFGAAADLGEEQEQSSARAHKEPVLHLDRGRFAPRGVLHEIPAMGGFILLLLLFCQPARAQQPAADLFKAKCAMCHGADAAGKTAMGTKLNIPDLRSEAVQKQSDKELTDAIAKGKNKMPGYEGKLTPAQITDVAGYVRGLSKTH